MTGVGGRQRKRAGGDADEAGGWGSGEARRGMERRKRWGSVGRVRRERTRPSLRTARELGQARVPNKGGRQRGEKEPATAAGRKRWGRVGGFWRKRIGPGQCTVRELAKARGSNEGGRRRRAKASPRLLHLTTRVRRWSAQAPARWWSVVWRIVGTLEDRSWRRMQTVVVGMNHFCHW